MSQPETPRARAKREQILTAARGRFLAGGYAGSSTDALAASAGVSKQTLYAYFPGKAELLAAVVTRELERLGGPEHPPAPTSRAELRGQLLAFASLLVEQLLQPDRLALLRLLVGEAAQLPALRPLLRSALPLRLLEAVQARLKAAQHAGLIHLPDPELSARMFVGPLMSYVMLDGLLGGAPPVPPPRATLERLTELFLLGLEVPADD